MTETTWADKLLGCERDALTRFRIRRFVEKTCRMISTGSRQAKGWYNIQTGDETDADLIAGLFDRISVKYRKVSATQLTALLPSGVDRKVQYKRGNGQ